MGTMTHACARCKAEKAHEHFRRTRATGWLDEDGRKRYSYCDECERERGRELKARRRANGAPDPQHVSSRPAVWKRADLLPVEPFQLWLRAKLTEYGSASALAVATDLGERRVRGILGNEQKWVSLDLVDWALTREESTFLFELYPHLYPGLDTQALSEVLDAVTVPTPPQEPWMVSARDEVIA